MNDKIIETIENEYKNKHFNDQVEGLETTK
jgi:hypothetical protein